MEMMLVDKCPQCGTEFECIDLYNSHGNRYLMKCPKCGFDKVVELVQKEDKRNDKPPLGVMPAELTAWSRISDLVDAIRRHCESTKGNEKLVRRWANEITWQCSIIESMKEDE